MENATKALLIAAAILIAIVLISLGVYVLGQGTTMVKDNSDMDGVEISTYNTKFEAYFGSNISGSKVKQLINTVNQHNRANHEDTSLYVRLTVSGITGGITGDAANANYSATINSGDTYKIELNTSATNGGYTKAGLINHIKITKNN